MTVPDTIHCMRSTGGVYVGRSSSAHKVRRIEERTGGYPVGHFGNPVVLGYACKVCTIVHEGMNGLACYSRWLWRRIRAESEWRAAVVSLAGKELACWCAPNPCHADVLGLAADVLTWPEASRDSWDERAAIIEFEAGYGRYQAERLAYAEVTG